MKLLFTGLIVFGCYTSLAKAEVSVVTKSTQTDSVTKSTQTDSVTKSTQTDLSFLDEYDAKIKQLNNYTVTFIDAKSPEINLISRAGRSRANDGFKVTLVHVKRKS